MINISNAVADNKVTINGVTFMVPDSVALEVLNLVSGCKVDATSKEVATSKSEPKTKTDRKPKAYKAAGDFEVPYEVRKISAKDWAVGFTSRIPTTAFKAVAAKAGSDWDKAQKCFHFPTKKSAEDFCKSYPVALATDRQAQQDAYKKA